MTDSPFLSWLQSGGDLPREEMAQLLGIDMAKLPPVRVSDRDVAKDPKHRAVMRAQAAPDSALEGELGVWHNPVMGGYSTEVSETMVDPRLNGGAPTNVPLMVQGQDQEAIQRILAGQSGGKEAEIALLRALQRVQQGQKLPAYLSVHEAVQNAGSRSGNKQGPWK